MSGENSEELRKIIVVDDAIDEGRYIIGVIGDVYEILGKEKFGEMDIKVGAYIVNENHIGELRERLREKYGREFVYDGLLGVLK